VERSETRGSAYPLVRLSPDFASLPGYNAIGLPSVEVAIEKPVQTVTCIVRCLAVVLQPVIKQGHAGLKMPVIETVVRAAIDN
jgi:hypothetical protein